MQHNLQIVAEWVPGVVLTAGALWLLYRALKRSDDPPLLLFKWVLTIPLLFLMIRRLVPFVAGGGAAGAYVGVPLAAVCGLILAIIWRRSLIGLVANRVEDLFTGGSQPAEPRPSYSIAQAKVKRGYYQEAVKEIRGQLEKFPHDFEGHVMMAQIQAEHLNDLPGAEVTLHRLCNQPGQPARTIAFAFNLLADWHLKLNQDREAARLALEEIIRRLPDTEMAVLAAQRIGHLAETDFLLESHERRRIAVKHGMADIGLLAAAEQPKAPEIDPARQATEYVEHLQMHPLDTEAREKLAILYADHYRNLALAADQLEQLISHANQPAKRVVHWLNLLADLQIRHEAGYEAGRQTLQRIIDLYPESPAACSAQNRLDLLKLEIKGKQKGQTVELGSYEQDIGLKGKLPHHL